jgi:hypothetical protein
MDDADETPYQARKKSRWVPPTVFSASQVWSAAYAAYRINNGYLKYPEYNEDRTKLLKPANRDLVKLFLTDPSQITNEDQTSAVECRKHLASMVTMAGLRGPLNDWDKTTARVCALDEISSNYDIAIITALPKSYIQQQKRDDVKGRLARCETSFVGGVGEKVTLNIEVVENKYSLKYGTNYITGITTDNQAVFFSYRESVKIGAKLHITGTVKRHGDRISQLTRVKVIGETK